MDDHAKCLVTDRTWDLTDPKDQQRAKNLPRKTKPKVLIASPQCTLFNTLRRLNPKPSSEAYSRAVSMIDFAVEMCMEQVKAGRHFVFEHPAAATSWKLPTLSRLSEVPGLCGVAFDMCHFGMTVKKNEGTEGLARKRTRVFTDSQAIDKLLNHKCSGGHNRIELLNGLAKQAAAYPATLCDAILPASSWRNCRGLTY